jgi:hypothetical protein
MGLIYTSRAQTSESLPSRPFESRSSSWAFAAPSPTFRIAAGDLEVFRNPNAAPGSPCDCSRGCAGLWRPSWAYLPTKNHHLALAENSRLSWVSSQEMEIGFPIRIARTNAPPATSPLASTPGRVAASRAIGVARPLACSDPVVLHHPAGFLYQRLAGLLHPAATRGVHRVSVKHQHPNPATWALTRRSTFRRRAQDRGKPCLAGMLGTFPQRQYPPKNSPGLQRFRITAFLAFLPF